MSKQRAPIVLLADDDPQFLRALEHHLSALSYRVESVTTKAQLLRRLGGPRPDLLLLDVRFGEHDGVDVLRQVLQDQPGLRVAMLTAHGSIDNAITATRLGAIDYLTKPVDLNRLRAVVAHVLDAPERTAKGAAAAAPGAAAARPPGRPILGESAAAARLRALIGRVAATDATALILGESGTGKELVARALHEQSARRDGPFVALNVAALPRELVESTLFGHAKGAFTGADQMQRGCCEAADKGTLFLDEIGEMEVGLQAKLLRFLQERSFQRVGQSSPVSVDVRIVAATNRDPAEQVRRGQLREDLYYRLNVVPIVLPPLRERGGDVSLLAAHFLRLACDRIHRDPLAFDPSALEVLERHPWPGNVRELENLAERLAILSPGPVIAPAEVRDELARSPIAAPPPPTAWASAPAPAADDPLREMDRIEKAAIAQALAASKGRVGDAARALGLGQATIYRKIKKYNISLRP